MSWVESDLLVEQMIKGSSGELWGNTLEGSDHFPILKQAFSLVGNSGSLLDIGCGAGDVSRVWEGEYTGIDLPWVVERVSKVCNSTRNYLPIDLRPSSLSLLPHARVVLMNAFLDVRDDPHEFLDALLKMNYENFIVHRQRLTNGSAKLEYRKSYGDSTVPSSIMSWDRIYQSVMSNDTNSKISVINWQSNWYTFVVSR